MVRRILALVALATPLFGHALDLGDWSQNDTLKITGFYDLTAGKVLSGYDSEYGLSHWTYNQWKCPCTVQNWEYVGVYEQSKGWETTPESLVGVQIKKDFTPTFSGTVQLVSRGDNTNFRPYTPTVDWAYLSWKPDTDSAWTFQAGRKRIPLYYYSDYLYIGYAYPWVRPAPDVYGWPIYTYDGVNATYERQLGDSGWSLTANAWWGEYTQKHDAYDTQIYSTPTPAITEFYQGNVRESWKDILGAYASVSNGVFELRGMSMQYRDNIDYSYQGVNTVYDSHVFTRIIGVAGNVDYKNLLIRTELDRFAQNPTQATNFIYDYALAGIGYHIGNFTPMFTFSRYTTQANAFAQTVEARNTHNFVVRWDFRKNMALKVQYDATRDESQYAYPFFGDTNLLSVSLQGIF